METKDKVTTAVDTTPYEVATTDQSFEVDGKAFTLVTVADVQEMSKHLGNTDVKAQIAFLGELDAEIVQGTKDAQDKHLAGLTRKVLVTRAEQFSGHDSVIREYLSGYGKKLGKSRASEARAVFDAFAKNPDEVLALDVGYSKMIEACREIRGKKSAGRQSGTRVVTSKTTGQIAETIPHLTDGQAALVLQDAARQVKATSGEKWEIALLRQIGGIARQIGESKHPIYQNSAKVIMAEVNKLDARETVTEHAESIPTPMSESSEEQAA